MMVKVGWKTKALIQGTLSRMPKAKFWNQAIQRRITRSLILDQEKFQAKLGFGREHVRNLTRSRGAVAGFTVLELGTGRFPIVPLYMFLCGAERVISLDITQLLRNHTVRDTLRMYQVQLSLGHLREARPERREKFLEIVSGQETRLGIDTLRQFNIEAIVGDARQTALPGRSFDLLVSNTTLEHIPRQILVEIFKHYRDLARRDAVMSHFIDMRDHYAEWDHSITVYNFMRYSERDWRWFNNSLLYQNRLRISDYRSIHAEAAWEIVSETADPGSRREFDSVPLAGEFRAYAERDLLVPTCWMVSHPGCLAEGERLPQ
jgi:hypothetical protein